MRYIRIVLGILLLVVSVSGLFFWETVGRTKLMMDEVIVAGKDIEPGTVIDAGMLSIVEIPKEGRVQRGFSAGEESLIVGRRTAFPISGKQQITAESFIEGSEEVGDGEAYFVIPARWIAMKSSALRRGDTVEILGEDAETSFGAYKLAFVKNVNEGEVRDLAVRRDVLSASESRYKRTDSDSIIDHVEIIATSEAYFKIRAYAQERLEPSLVLVQRTTQSGNNARRKKGEFEEEK